MTNVFTVEHATVYRAGGRRWFTQTAAVKAYANEKWRAKHPCECEAPDYSIGYGGSTCAACLARSRVMTRYLRIILKAIKRAAA